VSVNLECVASPDGSTVAPCPTGSIVVAVERPVAALIDDWGALAGLSAAGVIVLFATGLGVGWVIRLMEGK
jgi:hypothetical protein